MSIELTGLTWDHPRGLLPFLESGRLYEQQHSGVKVVWEAYPWDVFRERQFDEFRAGSTHFDVVQFDHPWLGLYSKNKWLIPIEMLLSPEQRHFLRSNCPEAVVESYVYDNALWALPVDMGAHVSYWRRDVLEKLGLQVPSSWEEVLETGRTLKASGYLHPFGFGHKTYQGFLFFLELLAEYNAIPDDDLVSALNSDETSRALALISKLNEFTNPDSNDWNPWDVGRAIASHETIVAAPSVFGYVDIVTRYEYSQKLITGLVPRLEESGLRRSLLGGVGLGISSKSEQRQGSCDYAWFNLDPTVCKHVALHHNGQPAVYFEADNERLSDFFVALRGNVKSAFIRPRSVCWPELELALGDHFAQFLHGRRAHAVLEGMLETTKAILDRK